MATRRNEFLDNDVSDESDLDQGYDSEAAELSKTTRASTSNRSTKRRKLSHSDDDSDVESVNQIRDANTENHTLSDRTTELAPFADVVEEVKEEADKTPPTLEQSTQQVKAQTASKSKQRAKEKETKPGVVYLSSLPPYLKPSALRNLLDQRGFSPVTRLFLAPASKAKTTSKKNSRQLYTEGWLEFASKKTARRCAETLNAQIVGGRKGGFYHDDLWNMKYLKGMSWNELMAGIREEKREEEGRRDEERRQVATETKRFIEGVEEGKKIEGIKRKRSEKRKKGDGTEGSEGTDGDVKRTWRQFEVKGSNRGSSKAQKSDGISDDVKEVLGKIF